MDQDTRSNEIIATGTDYMLRTTQQHHVQLSAMADLKASILITATSIVITAALALGSFDPLRYSLGTLLVGATAALVFALLAVIPRTSTMVPKPHESTFNLLFFGHFSQMSQDDFVGEIEKVTTDYGEIVRRTAVDIYGNGVYLAEHKYRYLRLAYLSFLAGAVSAATIEIGVRVLS